MIGDKQQDPLKRRELELQSLMTDKDINVREQADKDFIKLLENNPMRQTEPFNINGVVIGSRINSNL